MNELYEWRYKIMYNNNDDWNNQFNDNSNFDNTDERGSHNEIIVVPQKRKNINLQRTFPLYLLLHW
jgi:hypothetical protein